MKNSQLSLPENKAELKEIVLSQDKEIQRLNEEIRLLRHALFGPKSEKLPVGPNPQLHLFDMPENPPEEPENEEQEITVPEHTRQKRGRKKLPEDLPRIDVIHDIGKEEKHCDCGTELSRIGEEVSEKLDIIPAQIRVIRNIRPKYACKNCEGALSEDKSVKIAPAPPQIIPKGIATAGLLAYILVGKFCDALPFYRQEKQFVRIGIDIPRQTMCNWAMKAAKSCQPILTLLQQDIRGGPLINVDETPVQVLDEPGRTAKQKSYMWVFKGGTVSKPVIIYQYHPTRSGDVAKLFLKDYQGTVLTDAYSGYGFLNDWPGILHVFCWAHARRTFVVVKKASSSKKTGSADIALGMIRQLYALERIARQKDMTPTQIYEMRQNQAKPILAKFYNWLKKKQNHVTPKSLLGKAVNYCLNQWTGLQNYIMDGNAEIDNNSVENAIRPFTLGRKNWLFSGTPEGAQVSALLFSLVETAKANGLEPYRYLRFLFEKLPTTPSADFRQLLPTSLVPSDLVLPELPSGV
jgi:transposase